MAVDLRFVVPGTTAAPLHGQAASRAMEARACAQAGDFTLMQRAGTDAARLVLARWPHARRIWVACGPGNNGGDGLVMARRLHQLGRQVSITHLGSRGPAPADASRALTEAVQAGVPVGEPPAAGTVDLAVDALLGLGQNRAPSETVAALVDALHACQAPILALDLPTGLDTDSGQALGEHTVRAHATLCLLTLKPGLFTAEGRDHAGEIWWSTLGAALDSAAPDARLLGADDAQRLPPRPHAGHKGAFGDLWVLGGAPGMQGAALLAARAALSAGAGRVYLASLADAGALPAPAALMQREARALREPALLATATVVAGCGGGADVAAELPAPIHHAARLLLDADALNAVAAEPALASALTARGRAGRPTVLTPHPLEAARLLDSSTRAVQSNRLEAARALAQRFGAVVVLKGSGSVIAAPNGPPWINGSGNARLATAGTGDVLAGWLGGRWAALGDTADAPLRAACEAVWRHGRAADRAGPHVLIADALIDAMLASTA
ncbi:NAD(P)H-hydrate dehydratase [Ideonella sp. 4Y11]|uniref:Bifunctional NAD(P)H-hydrate repair enzyme n=1 Tax=Ideonella aquatica TaxID=2824119 RepID=A0A941BG82_9BURK|nr:NAD(P)H-hydrate dehydratase [Ideonella aquatica]MBQ0959546.1 NAD(P)H-hydrate dehydratase [Ideonella aquatica]